MTQLARLGLSLSVAMALGAGSASAMQDSRCAQIRTQIDNLRSERFNPARALQYQDAIARQRSEIGRTFQYAATLGCGPGGHSGGQCQMLDANVRQMQRNLATLQDEFERVSNSGLAQREAERRRLVANLNDIGCTGSAGARPLVANSGRAPALFQDLFGADPGSDEGYPPPPSAGEVEAAAPRGPDLQGPTGSNMRTICVRKCDGFYFPVSFATGSGGFDQDAEACRARCPAAEVELYAYDAFSQQPDDAVSASSGEPLKSMPNAFKFRTIFNRSCTCGTPGGDTRLSAGSPDGALRHIDETPGEPAETSAPMPAVKPRPPADSLPTTAGQTVETTAPDGQKKKVRIVGPPALPVQ